MQAAEAPVKRPDAADAVWDTPTTFIPEFILIGPADQEWDTESDAAGWMSVPLAVMGEWHFSLIDDDGTALHVYLPVVSK